jgi:hypothetical protein|uniref:Uncharacterized protein n=2 Tax=Oryza TaxID=4527 RepID=A0A0E0FVK7_ORYNI
MRAIKHRERRDWRKEITISGKRICSIGEGMGAMPRLAGGFVADCCASEAMAEGRRERVRETRTRTEEEKGGE